MPVAFRLISPEQFGVSLRATSKPQITGIDMERSTNLRNYTHDSNKGKDGREFIGGSNATKTPPQSAKNETVQSTVAKPSAPGPGGGKHSGK